jgi:hypothetical protein
MNDTKNTYNHLPVFDSDQEVLDHERESIAVYDLTSKQMISYSLTSGWVEFATKTPIKNIEDIEWVYIEEMATPNEEIENSGTNTNAGIDDSVIIPELINPN